MVRSFGKRALMLALVMGLVAPAAQAEDTPEGWTGELAASLTAQTGTTDSVAGGIDATGDRKWESDELKLRFSALYGVTRTRNKARNDQTTQNNQGLFATHKHTIHERFFWTSGAELSRDTVQDRAVRAALQTGPGYRFWEGDTQAAKRHFEMNIGVGYRFEIYDLTTVPTDVQRSQYDDDQFVDAIAGFEYKNLLFDDNVEYTHTGSVNLPANAPDAYVLRTEVILGVPLSKAWSLRAAFLAEYVAEQPDEINNTTTRTTIGLGYKF